MWRFRKKLWPSQNIWTLPKRCHAKGAFNNYVDRIFTLFVDKNRHLRSPSPPPTCPRSYWMAPNCFYVNFCQRFQILLQKTAFKLLLVTAVGVLGLQEHPWIWGAIYGVSAFLYIIFFLILDAQIMCQSYQIFSEKNHRVNMVLLSNINSGKDISNLPRIYTPLEKYLLGTEFKQ